MPLLHGNCIVSCQGVSTARRAGDAIDWKYFRAQLDGSPEMQENAFWFFYQARRLVHVSGVPDEVGR